MARIRTTVDVWELQGDFGQGYEFLCGEFSRFESKERLKEYRSNSPGAYRIVKKREKKSDYSDEQLARIAAQRKEGDKKSVDRLLARRKLVVA